MSGSLGLIWCHEQGKRLAEKHITLWANLSLVKSKSTWLCPKKNTYEAQKKYFCCTDIGRKLIRNLQVQMEITIICTHFLHFHFQAILCLFA